MLDTVRKSAENARFCAPAVRPGEEDGDLDSHASNATEISPQSSLLRRERSEIIRKEVGRLPAKYQTVIRLRYLEGLTHREIGEALNVNESRACQIHHDALNRLKRALGSRGLRGFSQM
jgi:RNA polymerase sigma factor for flagellar operon FliA